MVLGIGKVSPVLFVSSPERPAAGFMAGFLQARGLLKVERELLRLSGKDGAAVHATMVKDEGIF